MKKSGIIDKIKYIEIKEEKIMDRMKTFLKYALWIIGFWILSNFLIEIGLNSSYDKITRRDNIVTQVEVNQAEATLVNGRVKGTIKNSTENNLSGKYIRFDFYSPRDLLLGTKYIEVGDLEENGSKDFEIYFKLQDVESYDVKVTDEIEEVDDTPFFSKEFLQSKVIYWVILAIIIW